MLRRLAAVDTHGAAGANHDPPAASTASWLRGRLHRGATTGRQRGPDRPGPVRRPLTPTARALCAGQLSATHAAVLAHGTSDLPAQVAAEAEPVLVAAARRLDAPRLRPAIGHLQQATGWPVMGR